MVIQSITYPWWRHQMEASSALLAICAGNSPVTSKFPAQRPVTRSFDVFFDLRLNKRLSKQWRGWWFVTPSRPSWRHCNVARSSVLTHLGIVTRDDAVVFGQNWFRQWGVASYEPSLDHQERISIKFHSTYDHFLYQNASDARHKPVCQGLSVLT